MKDKNEDLPMWPTPKAGQTGMTAKTSGRDVSKSTHLSTRVALEEGLIDPETGCLWKSQRKRAEFKAAVLRMKSDER
tara:strand:+ start:361 stop:591 length:231 start_codon:yes stop_codon:yes gene_type:complete